MWRNRDSSSTRLQTREKILSVVQIYEFSQWLRTLIEKNRTHFTLELKGNEKFQLEYLNVRIDKYDYS